MRATTTTPNPAIIPTGIKIGRGLVGEFRVEADGRRVRTHVAKHERVPVGRRTQPRALSRRRVPPAPQHVLHHDGAPKGASHVLADYAGDRVRRPACVERHDQRDRPLWDTPPAPARRSASRVAPASAAGRRNR